MPPSTSISFGAIEAVVSFYNPASVPLALSSASPRARLAGEVAAFSTFPRTHGEEVPRRGVVGLDPARSEREAAIADMQHFERTVWWLTRHRSAVDRSPYPLRSVHFCMDNAVEGIVDVVARVPLCAATLTRLDLNARCDTHNSISSLRAISRLVGLRELRMPHTTVLPPPSTALPVTWTEELHAVLCNLRTLVVGDYYLVQHLPLADLQRLEEVDLSGTGVNAAVVDALAGCPRVRSLMLRGCRGVSSFAPLAALRRLTLLDLSFTRVRDDELRLLCRCCPHLSTLRLCSCDGLRDFSPLGQLQSLACLHVGRTAIRNADLERVSALPELCELNLESCRHLDVFTPLAHLATLRELDVRNTWIDNAGVAALARCRKLTHLNLSQCVAADVFAPLAALAELRHLSLSRSPISDACLRAICTPTVPLATLLLNGCRLLRDFTPLGCLSAVQEIGVCDTAFDDGALRAVAACRSLVKLHLHVCSGVSTLWPLTSCPRLHHLGIGGTRFSGRCCCEAACVALQQRGVQLSHQLLVLSVS